MESTNAVGFMNVILLHSNHKHVSVTHVTIFRSEQEMQLQCVVKSIHC